MHAVYTWCVAHWGWLTVALLFVASILNSVTRHFGARHPRIVPVIGVLLEALSILTSRGAVNGVLPGPLGRLKAPLQNIAPVGAQIAPAKKISGAPIGLLGLMLIMSVSAVGCASSWQGDLAKGLSAAQRAGDAVFNLVRPAYQVQCRAASVACKVPLEQCPGYVACDGERQKVFAALQLLQSGVVAVGEVAPQIERRLKEVSK